MSFIVFSELNYGNSPQIKYKPIQNKIYLRKRLCSYISFKQRHPSQKFKFVWYKKWYRYRFWFWYRFNSRVSEIPLRKQLFVEGIFFSDWIHLYKICLQKNCGKRYLERFLKMKNHQFSFDSSFQFRWFRGAFINVQKGENLLKVERQTLI